MHVVLRTTLPASALAPTLERVVHAIDPSVPIVALREMNAVFYDSIGRPRLLAQLLAAFAGLALPLAVVGTYGVLSFMVAERRREIGIRLAIGATRGDIVSLVTKQGLAIVSIRLGVGLAGALAASRLLRRCSSASGPGSGHRRGRHRHHCARGRTGVRVPCVASVAAHPNVALAPIPWGGTSRDSKDVPPYWSRRWPN